MILVHTKQVKPQLGVGLGANTMEGKAAKHVSLAKFANNTHHTAQWVKLLRHEYISLVWLQVSHLDGVTF